jgi:hypothetical protein
MNSTSMIGTVVLSTIISYWHFRKTYCIHKPWKCKCIQLQWSFIDFIITTLFLDTENSEWHREIKRICLSTSNKVVSLKTNLGTLQTQHTCTLDTLCPLYGVPKHCSWNRTFLWIQNMWQECLLRDMIQWTAVSPFYGLTQNNTKHQVGQFNSWKCSEVSQSTLAKIAPVKIEDTVALLSLWMFKQVISTSFLPTSLYIITNIILIQLQSLQLIQTFII